MLVLTQKEVFIEEELDSVEVSAVVVVLTLW